MGAALIPAGATTLLDELRALGVSLEVVAGNLRYHPRQQVTGALLERLRSQKAAVIDLLSGPVNLETPGDLTDKTIGRSSEAPSAGSDGSLRARLQEFAARRAGAAGGAEVRPEGLSLQDAWDGLTSKTITSTSHGYAPRLPTPDRIAPVSPCRLCGAGRLWRLAEVTTWWCEACLPCCLPANEVVWADVPEAGGPPSIGTPARSPVAWPDAEVPHA